MRSVAVLLSVGLLVPAALAVKPDKPGSSVEETLKYINERLLIDENSNPRCSDRIQVSLSENRRDIILRSLLIDKHGKIKDDAPPRYVYRVPVMFVKSAYPWGPWTTHDRVIVRVQGSAVKRYGPVWDCNHNRMNDPPKERYFGSVELKAQESDDNNLYRVADAVNHLVKLLNDELDAMLAPAAKAPEANAEGRRPDKAQDVKGREDTEPADKVPQQK